MVLQVAVQDIGQLTDIHHPPGTGKPPTLNGVASIGTGLANLHRKTGHRLYRCSGTSDSMIMLSMPGLAVVTRWSPDALERR